MPTVVGAVLFTSLASCTLIEKPPVPIAPVPALPAADIPAEPELPPPVPIPP